MSLPRMRSRSRLPRRFRRRSSPVDFDLDLADCRNRRADAGSRRCRRFSGGGKSFSYYYLAREKMIWIFPKGALSEEF